MNYGLLDLCIHRKRKCPVISMNFPSNFVSFLDVHMLYIGTFNYDLDNQNKKKIAKFNDKYKLIIVINKI